MRPEDVATAQELENKLEQFNNQIELPGINQVANRDCFIEQIIDSIKRVKYIQVMSLRTYSENFSVGNSDIFDPLKAAIWYKNSGNINEAYWLVFLSIHFGMNSKSGWRLLGSIYSGLGGFKWNWERVSKDPTSFRQWLLDNQDEVRTYGGFGNHRKYQSLNAERPNGTGAAIQSYIEWIGEDHEFFLNKVLNQVKSDPKKLFDHLYRTLNVESFGRTAKFDYLTMLGKMGLAPIEPGSAYLVGSTGPLRGARLLFQGSVNGSMRASELESLLNQLEEELGLSFGMQVLEDSLCNWQKNPAQFEHFRG